MTMVREEEEEDERATRRGRGSWLGIDLVTSSGRKDMIYESMMNVVSHLLLL